MTTTNKKHPGGAPKGSQNHLVHGLAALQNEIKRRVRRGRSLIDRRSKAGQNAVAVREQLIADMGGADNISAAKLVLIEMVGRDIYFLDECDRRIFQVIYRVNAELKKRGIPRMKNPKLIGTMYSYRQGVARNLAANLSLLGLEKVPPPAKTLEEILAAGDEEDNSSGGENGGEQR